MENANNNNMKNITKKNLELIELINGEPTKKMIGIIDLINNKEKNIITNDMLEIINSINCK